MENQKHPTFETARGVHVTRVWRPGFRQAGHLGRLLNAIWMIAAWSLLAFRGDAPDLLLMGTDPILSVLVAIPWKLIRPRTKIVHWCFDLYPEAAIADGTLASNGILHKLLRRLVARAYSCCDLILDIGPCMRQLLTTYSSAAEHLTTTPWALSEPANQVCADTSERRTVFGDAKLGLMYSGNFGRAHSFEEVLEVARALRDEPIQFAFSVRGNRTQALRDSVSDEDKNISFVPFAGEQRIQARLSAADIHIVTLRYEWTGSVVPSKFFGAIAAGRPVLFVGRQHSSIANWIKRYGLGWVLDNGNHSAIAARLRGLAANPEEVTKLFEHCHRVYQRHFARTYVIDHLERELRNLVSLESRSRPVDAAHAEGTA